MLAVLLSICIFLVFFLIGFAAVSILNPRRTLLLNVLIAPATGISVLLFPTIFLNRMGIPVHSFAAIMVAGLVLLSILALALKRPLVPWRAALPFFILLPVAFFLLAWPFFQFGFDWVSVSNDDMTNYALAADRFAHTGNYTPPPPPIDNLSIFRGYDFAYWVVYAVNTERAGVEHLLALVISIVGMRGFLVFMPLILAGYPALIWASSALLLRRSSQSMPALLLGIALALSGLTALGVLLQLLAQVYGLTLLAATIAILARPATFSSFDRKRGGLLFIGLILFSGLLAVYPELVPVSALALCGYAVVLLYQRRAKLGAVIGTLFLAAASPLVLLQGNALEMGTLILRRLDENETRTVVSLAHKSFLFPYYLLPSGFANLWGLIPLATVPSDPWISIGIAVGMLLTCILVICVIRGVWNLSGAAWVTGIMLLMATVFYVKRGDFALYKLAMYLQPFMLATIIAEMFRLRRIRLSLALFVLVLGANLYGQQRYVNISRDIPGSGGVAFVEVPHASYDRLLDQLRSALQRKNGSFVSDASYLTLAKYEDGYVRNQPIFFDVKTYQLLLLGVSIKRPLPWPLFEGWKRRIQLYNQYFSLVRRDFVKQRFNFGPVRTEFLIFAPSNVVKDDWLIASTERQSVLNRSESLSRTADIDTRRESELRNHLSFVESSVGLAPGGISDLRLVTFFQLEPDYFYRDSTMSGLGRYLLFKIHNPSRRVRLVFDATASLNADGHDLLPPAHVFGVNSVSLALVGRGSARVVSPPIVPKQLSGTPYIGLDMGRSGHLFPSRRTGLMKLFGNDISLDPRLLVAFGRNISLVSEADYRAWRPPSNLSVFPRDLANPSLEYSGIYEDGWIAEESYFVLGAPKSEISELDIDGVVPRIASEQFNTLMTIAIDDRKLGSERLPLGTFAVRRRMQLAPGRHKVRLRFDRVQTLPGIDGRKTAARLSFIGFVQPERLRFKKTNASAMAKPLVP